MPGSRGGYATGTGVEVRDEGVTSGTVYAIDFVGAGVQAGAVNGVLTVNIPGGGGGGDMLKAVYDPAGIAEQLVGLTSAQALSNKTGLISQWTNDTGYLTAVAFTNSSDATSHTVTLTGGTSFKLVEGTGVTLTTTGTAGNGIVTIASTGGGDVTKVGTPVNNQVGVWTGDGTIEGDAALTYDSATDTLTSVTFAGALTGNASTATALATARTIGGVNFDGTASIVPQTIQSINEATDTTCFPLFITASGTQSLQPLNNAGFIYNSSANSLTATTFIGALTGTASGNANLALSNLASVAINTDLISDTDVTDDLGSLAIRWDGIFAQTLNTGDTAADTLKIRGYDVDGAAFVDVLTITANNTVTADLWTSTTLGGQYIYRAGGTDVPVTDGGTGLSSISALSIWVANSANTITSVTPGAGQSVRINAGNTAWEAFTPGTAGANTALSNLASVAINTSLLPTSDNAITLGSGTKQWQIGYIGTSLNFGNGDVVQTYTANKMEWTGATSGYFFDDDLVTSNAGQNLGVPVTGEWNNLYLLEGGTINWDNGDAVITQTGNDLTVSGITTFGLGTGTAVGLGTIELGHASDTTLSRSAAGIVAVEGVAILKSSAGVGTTPTSSTTTTITHNLGKKPVMIRIWGKSGFTSNAAATPTTSSEGIWNSSGNFCIYQSINGTTTIAAQTSNTFAIFLDTSVGNTISGVIGNVTSTGFDIVWTETGTHTRGVYMWESE